MWKTGHLPPESTPLTLRCGNTLFALPPPRPNYPQKTTLFVFFFLSLSLSLSLCWWAHTYTPKNPKLVWTRCQLPAAPLTPPPEPPQNPNFLLVPDALPPPGPVHATGPLFCANRMWCSSIVRHGVENACFNHRQRTETMHDLCNRNLRDVTTSLKASGPRWYNSGKAVSAEGKINAVAGSKFGVRGAPT